MANPQVIVDFVANTAKLSSGLQQAGGSAEGFGSKIKGVARAGVAAAGAAGLGALIATTKIGIDEMTEASKVSAQTAAVLKSTGKAAGVSAGDVAKLAEQLMRKSGVDDETIQSGENLLLTFTNIQNKVGAGNDIFNRATATMLDMSVALGQDTKSSAVQLGKALNDPIKGITALSRVGVSFTQGQKDTIKSLVESGDTMGAQKIILAELNKEFGGSATAAGKTLPGQINVLKESFSNLAGELMTSLMPAFKAVTDFLVKNPGLAKAMVVGILAVAAAMVLLNVALAITTALASPWILIAAGIVAGAVALGAAFVYAYKHSETFAAIVDKAFSIVKTAATALFNWVKGNWPLLLAIIGGPIVAAAIVVARNWETIRSVTTGAWEAIKSAITDAVSGIKGGLSAFGSWISGFAHGALKTAVNAVTDVLDRIGDAGHAAYAAVKESVGKIAGAITAVKDAVGRAASDVAGAIKGPINAVVTGWNSLAFPRVSINVPKFKIGKKSFGGGSFGFGPFPFPNMPSLAKGGVVADPTLALVGDVHGGGREIVAPEALLREIVAGAGGPQVRVFIGDTELRGIVRTEVVDATTGVARTLIANRA